MPGPLALVGGVEWTEGCTFDRELLDASGGDEVVVLPAAAAYEHPARAVEQAQGWFETLGGRARGVMALGRTDAFEKVHVAAVRDARFIYLSHGSPMHLRSVLRNTPLWDALLAAWEDGAVVAGSGSGGGVLCDPMVDPRGGAFTVGLGLVAQLAFIPHHDTWSEDKARRTIALAPAGLPIAAVDERTALIRDTDGGWRVTGAGGAVVFRDGAEAGLDVLPG